MAARPLPDDRRQWGSSTAPRGTERDAVLQARREGGWPALGVLERHLATLSFFASA